MPGNIVAAPQNWPEVDMTNQYLMSPLVGTSFRPFGKALLTIIQIGQELILEPEPENQYDPDAVRVLIDLRRCSVPKSTEADEVFAYLRRFEDFDPEETPIVHLGYLPKSGGRFDTLKCGNREVKSLMSDSDSYRATFALDPAGKPLVKIIPL